MAAHSSILAWRIPGTEEPGGLLSTGSHRVGHDWSDLAAAAVVFQIGGILEKAKATETIIWLVVVGVKQDGKMNRRNPENA